MQYDVAPMHMPTAILLIIRLSLKLSAFTTLTNIHAIRAFLLFFVYKSRSNQYLEFDMEITFLRYTRLHAYLISQAPQMVFLFDIPIKCI